MDALFYQIALTLLPKVGPVIARQLVSYCGGVAAVFNTPKKQLLKIPGVGAGIAQHIIARSVFKRAEEERKFIDRHEIHPLFYLDPDYPQRLTYYNDSPVLLYFRGSIDLNGPRHLGIVGTRKPSTYGIDRCMELVDALKDVKPVIISGLAYGIDITAHRQCLQHQIPTVGVVGHGLQQVYPSSHTDIARQMQACGGLLSEYPSQTGPDFMHFPMRNRIIASLCDAIIVVETKNKGGSMITAKMANQYNKDVFAIPGRTTDQRSAGCNLLIKSHQASLLESVKDLIYVMRWEEEKPATGIQKRLFVELGPDEKLIVDLLREDRSMGIDQLAFQTGIPNSNLAGLLLELEFKGVVRSLPGSRYSLIQ
jgi:DNA processing protein